MGGGFALLLAADRWFTVSSVNFGTAPKDAYTASFLRRACPIVGSYGGKDRTLRGPADHMVLAERAPVRFLARDRDAKFTSGFDEVLRSERIRVIRTLVRSPRSNAFAERFVGTIRRECLNRMLIFHRRQREAVLAEFADHDNCHRPYRSLDQTAPLSMLSPAPPSASCPDANQLRRSDRLGGLIHEYKLA